MLIWSFVWRVRCAKVIGATSSEGFLIVLVLSLTCVVVECGSASRLSVGPITSRQFIIPYTGPIPRKAAAPYEELFSWGSRHYIALWMEVGACANVDAARRRGRPRTAWMDNIKT